MAVLRVLGSHLADFFGPDNQHERPHGQEGCHHGSNHPQFAKVASLTFVAGSEKGTRRQKHSPGNEPPGDYPYHPVRLVVVLVHRSELPQSRKWSRGGYVSLALTNLFRS